jgi:hypothetical protein
LRPISIEDIMVGLATLGEGDRAFQIPLGKQPAPSTSGELGEVLGGREVLGVGVLLTVEG